MTFPPYISSHLCSADVEAAIEGSASSVPANVPIQMESFQLSKTLGMNVISILTPLVWDSLKYAASCATPEGGFEEEVRCMSAGELRIAVGDSDTF